MFWGRVYLCINSINLAFCSYKRKEDSKVGSQLGVIVVEGVENLFLRPQGVSWAIFAFRISFPRKSKCRLYQSFRPAVPLFVTAYRVLLLVLRSQGIPLYAFFLNTENRFTTCCGFTGGAIGASLVVVRKFEFESFRPPLLQAVPPITRVHSHLLSSIELSQNA